MEDKDWKMRKKMNGQTGNGTGMEEYTGKENWIGERGRKRKGTKWMGSRCNRGLLAQKPEVVTVSQHHRIFN